MEPIFQILLGKIKNEYPFTLVDIGAMGGVGKKWDFISDFIKIIAFEPDEREFNKLKNNDNVIYFNYAIYNTSKDIKFYNTKGRGKSSTFKPNINFLSQFENVERFHVEKEEIIPSEKVKTLDSIIEENLIIDVDFIKLDTQGSELKILEGCQKYVIPRVFGIQIEVEFIEIYQNQPLFRNVDEFMHRNGFHLIDLRRHYWKRKDYYDYSGKGQLVFGDALYFKRTDVLFRELHELQDKSYATSKIYKIVLVCLKFRMFDYAVSVVKIGLELDYLSQSDYKNFMSMMHSYSKRRIIPNLRDMVIVIKKKIRPGWSDCDMEIGNIKDV
jgi:FkbM family methyltransferase